MVIQDLGIIELVDSSTFIMGGVKTTANANSKAGSGTAQAGAEAGALGKSVDKSRVCPVLFRIKRSEISGPMLQFQSTVIEKEDVYKLLKSINDACGTDSIDESRLEKGFDVWWPFLEQDLGKIPNNMLLSADLIFSIY